MSCSQNENQHSKKKKMNSSGRLNDRIVLKRLILSMSVTKRHNVMGEKMFVFFPVMPLRLITS